MHHPFADDLRRACQLRNTTPDELAQRDRRISPKMMHDILHWIYPSYSPDVIDWLDDSLDLQGYERRAFFEAADVSLEEQANRLFYHVFTQLCQERNMTITQVAQGAGLLLTEVQAIFDAKADPADSSYTGRVEKLANVLQVSGEERLMFFRSAGFEFFRGERNLATPANEPLQVFYCYAQQDRKLREALDKHLASLKRIGTIVTWYDCEIQAGTDWEHEVVE